MIKAFFIGFVGLFITGIGLFSLWQVWQSRAWPTTEAVVESIRTESERQDRATDKVYTSKNFEHTLYGRYAFVVNGQRYLSRERRLDSTTNKNPVASFAVQAGDTISVRYDPDDPNRNRPEDDAPVGTAILMLVIGLLTMLTSGWFARA